MDSPQNLVVGYDGSSLSELALHRALRMTERSRFAMIHVVTVVEEDGDTLILPTGERLSRWAALDTLRHILHRTTKGWELRRPQVRVVAHLRIGEPGQVIVDLAYRYHADQIVIGVRTGGNPSAPIGDVASRILELSEIPVHLENPLSSRPPSRRVSPLRWAYVFGGPTLRTDRLGAISATSRPLA